MKLKLLMLLMALAGSLSACTLKVSDRTGDKDATRQFLNEYAGKTAPDSAARTSSTEISPNGALTYTHRGVKDCTVTVSGRIEGVTLYPNSKLYAVRYFYQQASTNVRACANNDGLCKLDQKSCMDTSDEISRRLNSGTKTVMVSQGENPKGLMLQP